MIEFDTSDLERAVTEMAQQVTASLDESALRAVGFAGAEIFRDEAKRNALGHVKTSVIYNSIIVKRLEEESDGGKRQAYLVTVRKGKFNGNDAYYWRWVENGHKIVPRKKKGVTWKAHRAAAALEFGNARVPAYPFMRPAYESKKGAAIDVMNKKLREQMERNATR